MDSPAHWKHGSRADVALSVKSHYVDVAPSSGQGNGHTLVLIHGHPETWYCCRKVIQPFDASVPAQPLETKAESFVADWLKKQQLA